MGSPQATIRPLVINKRKSLEAVQKPQSDLLLYSTVSSPEHWTKTERARLRRFSLPVQVIPETSEISQGSGQCHQSQAADGPASRRNLDRKSELLQKAKELEREAYRALFQAEYLRWQAENDCHNVLLNSSIPSALSSKAEELGLRSQNLSLNSKSTTSLKALSDLDTRRSSFSGHMGIPVSNSMSTPRPTSIRSPGLASPFSSSSGYLEYEDSELKPILRTGKRTLKKARSRAMGPSKHPELRSFLPENDPPPRKKRFLIRCPFAFLLCSYRRNKYRPCRRSLLNTF